MEVILIQDVANLGYKNDIIKVKDGYGRNYLIPNKMAVIANDSNRKQLAENLKQQAHKMAKLLADAQALAEKLAYPIQGKTTGFYALLQFDVEPEMIAKLETAFRRDERVLRFLTTRLDKYAFEYSQKRRNANVKPVEQEEA